MIHGRSGGRGGGTNWEIRTGVYTLPWIKQTAGRKLRGLDAVLCDGLEEEYGGGRETPEGGTICIRVYLYPSIYNAYK